jgi:hypothetical protein
MLKEIPKDIMYVYLGGLMVGGDLQKATIDWRYKIRKHFSNWKGQGLYEFSILDPYNGEIGGNIDKEGLTNSLVPGKAIYEGDKLAIQKADIIIANFNQYGSSRISVGTFMECGMALAWNKPLILIVPENELERWSKHPFTSQAVAIFTSVEKLLESKILNWFYKRVNHANYEWEL